MAHSARPPVSRLTVEARGRVVIPVELRRASGIEPGSELLVYTDGEGRLVLEAPREMARRLRGSWRHLAGSRDLMAELLEDRRAEAALEHAEAAGDESAVRAARGRIAAGDGGS